MQMETVEEEVVVAPPCHNNVDLSPVAKGKRTKRQRPQSPIPFTVIDNSNHRLSPSFSSTTTEEEDTARCLILLSRGHFLRNDDDDDHLDLQHDHQYQYKYSPKQISRRPQPLPATPKRDGTYACKTCNRVFSSFQALGGHRTSHKKPKKTTALFPDLDDDFPSPSSKKRIPPSLSLQLSSTATGGGRQLPPSPRIHECSYCGAEFTSGQALGGHMRRHRAGPTSPLPVKPRNGLSLDLNFPAPEDEKSPEKTLVLSTTTPTMVDCHY